MPNQRLRALAAVLTLAASSLAAFALAAPAEAAVPGQIVVTEWMYQSATTTGGAPEFVELTNIGGEPVDMSTYSFDDDSKLPGTVSLAGMGTLAPAESGLIVEGPAAAFRSLWGLASSVPIVDNNTAANLGRNDEINIFDGSTLADRFTYGDQNIPGTIRTQGKSGVPATCLGLGANNVESWRLSVVGDSLGSRASAPGATTVSDIGSPGTTPLGACGPVPIAGDRNGVANPCTPEAASGTGPETPGAQPWPGSASVTVADGLCAWKTATGPEGRDMSGLVFDPTNPDVLYAAKNKDWVFRLVKQGGLWVPDTTNGWGAGKQIFFPGGVNLPDSEGLTVGPDGALYVTTERDNLHNSVPLDSILRFDPTTPGTTLTPTQQWDLTADFLNDNPSLGANLGFEGVTFVPDTYLVQNGFVDQSTHSVYYPSDYPYHGSGLFFAALENDGKLYAYALNDNGTGTFQRIAVVDSGMGHVMDVQYDADLQRIWALCDNTCSVTSTLLKVDTFGTIVPDVRYARPADATAGLPIVNIEGFAIAPDSTCADGVKEVVWSDDGIAGPGHEGHALYSGTFPCGLDLGHQGAPAAVDLGARGRGDVSVPKKGTVHVHGSGFEPGETVRIELHDKKKVDVLATVVADDFGLAIADVTIPAGVQPGAQEIWLVAPSATVKAGLTITTPAAHP